MAIEKPDVSGIAHALPPPDVVPVPCANIGIARNIIAIIRKNSFDFIVLLLLRIVVRRWLRSTPGGERPHADDGIMPTYKSCRAKSICAENQCSSATAPATYIIVSKTKI